MAIPRLFVTTRLEEGAEVELDGERSRYLLRVLRCRPGDRVTLFDGSGREFDTAIDGVRRQRARLAVGDGRRRDVESPLPVRLIQGVARGERMDTVVRKSTELGVHRIAPALTALSVVRLDDERRNRRLSHWRRVSRSACEQCGRNVPPHIEAPTTLAELLAAPADNATLRLMPVPGARPVRSRDGAQPAQIELLIGPEGGLHADEYAQAQAAGFQAVGLGPRILRTETAAIAALAILQSLWGDLG